jgi:Ribosomal protein S19
MTRETKGQAEGGLGISGLNFRRGAPGDGRQPLRHAALGLSVGQPRSTALMLWFLIQRLYLDIDCRQKTRSLSCIKKGPYVDERLLAKVEKQHRGSGREPLKTWSRDCTIVPDFIPYWKSYDFKTCFRASRKAR